jgi:hypothetical protein
MMLSVLVAVAVGCGDASTEPAVVGSENPGPTTAGRGQATDSSAHPSGVTTIAEVIATTPGFAIYEEGPLRKIDTGGDQMDAALRGHLAIVGGCVVQQGINGQATIVLWPVDVHWDDKAQAVVFADDRRLTLGTEVVLGGGGISIEEIKTYWANGQSAAEALATCQPDVSLVWVAGGDIGLVQAFDLYTHCGIYGTMIDGVWWRANPPLGDGHGGPPEDWADPSQPGTMTFYGDDLAVFTTDQGLLARFKPTTSIEPQVTCD